MDESLGSEADVKLSRGSLWVRADEMKQRGIHVGAEPKLNHRQRERARTELWWVDVQSETEADVVIGEVTVQRPQRDLDPHRESGSC